MTKPGGFEITDLLLIGLAGIIVLDIMAANARGMMALAAVIGLG